MKNETIIETKIPLTIKKNIRRKNKNMDVPDSRTWTNLDMKKSYQTLRDIGI